MEDEKDTGDSCNGTEGKGGEVDEQGITEAAIILPRKDANSGQIQPTNDEDSAHVNVPDGVDVDGPLGPTATDDPSLLLHKHANVGLDEGNGSLSPPLEDVDIEEPREGGGEEEDGQNKGEADLSLSYPLRPYAVDCAFYLNTGTCKYGFNCRFNHPLKMGLDQVHVGEKEKEGHGLSEDIGKIKCKYYLKPGGCKYGDSCRYVHSKEETESEPPLLNFLGLPIRLGEKECSFYMRNGSCAYEANCRFHHPDPTEAKEAPDHSLVNNNNGTADHSSQSFIHKDVKTYSLGLSHASIAVDGKNPEYGSSLTLESLHGKTQISNWTESQYHHPEGTLKNDPNKAGHGIRVRPDSLADYRLMHYTEFPERPGLPECQYFMKTGDCKFRSACRYHHPKSRLKQLAVDQLTVNQLPLRPAAIYPPDNSEHLYTPSNYVKSTGFKDQQQIPVEEYPERPGAPDCAFYMRTGDCKYRSACRYHHPKIRASASLSIPPSDRGLPLRPGRRICRNYEQQGSCRYGARCLFDHPVNISSSAYASVPASGCPSVDVISSYDEWGGTGWVI